MSDQIEWRRLYADRHREGKETLFVSGRARGDYYHATAGVWRVRLWSDDRLQGGRERLVLTEEAARAALLRMWERFRDEGADDA